MTANPLALTLIPDVIGGTLRYKLQALIPSCKHLYKKNQSIILHIPKEQLIISVILFEIRHLNYRI
jgi:hypothetical protein